MHPLVTVRHLGCSSRFTTVSGARVILLETRSGKIAVPTRTLNPQEVKDGCEQYMVERENGILPNLV